MEKRKTQLKEGAGGRASAQVRWLPFVGVSAALVAVLIMAAPAGGGGPVSTKLAPAMVTATNYQFAPRDVTINQGESVTWTNGGGTHNVVIEAEGLEQPSTEAPPGPPNWPVTHAFNTPGTFTYYCRPHRSFGMTGTVTVNAAAPPPEGSSPPPPGGGSPSPGGGSEPGTPAPGAPGAGKASTTVTLQVSDATPARGVRVRFFGTVKPEQDGRLLQLQRRTRGSFRTVARIKLGDAGTTRSKFSKRLRMLGDAVFRARLPADSAHEAGTSRARRLDVH
jgi:plastocyanin